MVSLNRIKKDIIMKKYLNTQIKEIITKAKKILNWEPKIELEKGIVKTIQYYKEL